MISSDQTRFKPSEYYRRIMERLRADHPAMFDRLVRADIENPSRLQREIVTAHIGEPS